MAANPGDLAWAGPDRLIWLVLEEHVGIPIRRSDQRWHDTPYELGVMATIRAAGLHKIPDTVELTDEEWALAVKGALLYAR